MDPTDEIPVAVAGRVRQFCDTGEEGIAMQIRRLATGLFAVLWLVGMSGVDEARAAVMHVVSGGQLVGATGINVGGTFYDVEFVDGTCIDLYSGCDESADFYFNTAADAQAASQALLDQVFLDNGMAFDSIPDLTAGCSSPFGCIVNTPYAAAAPIGGDVALVESALNTATTDEVLPPGTVVSTSADTTPESTLVWAVWETNPEPAPIPEPGAALLFAVGLPLVVRRMVAIAAN